MKRCVFVFICCFSIFFIACGSNTEAPVIQKDIEAPVTEESTEENTQVSTANTILETEYRDNSPECLVPEASGTIIFDNKYASIDASNAQEGYIMVKYLGDNHKVKLQIIGPDSVPYTYNLFDSDYDTFPLSSGSGDYSVKVYENIQGTQYSSVLAATIKVQISNEFGPNLYPNQYCDFNKSSLVVAKAVELTHDCKSDLEVVTVIYDYVSSNIVYDHDKAATVESGYLCDVDAILNSNTGICLDYAAVMTSMLRSQGIPTRLEVGYAGSAYHAWISTYIKDIGWVNGIIQFDGVSWSLMDPTFAANSSTESLKTFIGDGSNYQTKYVY